MRRPVILLMFTFCVTAEWTHAWSGRSLTSEIRPQNGQPALFVNGKLTSSLTFFARNSTDAEPFLKAGFNIVDFSVPFGWKGPEQYDFTETDAVMDEFSKTDPNLLLLPRFDITPEGWWCKVFPGEITLREGGAPAVFPNISTPCHPSFASEIYRKLAQAALKAFITHLESKYGSRIVGYFPGNGVYGEWFSWNAYWEVPPGSPPPEKFGVEDYSVPARKAFQGWVKEHYRGDVAALRKAWGNPNVDFDAAAVPSEKTRSHPPGGIFFDPAISQQVPDYFEFFNNLVSDVLIEQCRWIKELTGRRKAVGAFYGYLWANYPHLSMNHSGHLGFSKVLASPDVDFIAGPYTYDNRGVGGGNNAQTLPATIALHGKLYFNEVDTETHSQQRQWRWGNSLRNPRNFEETRGLLLRDFAYAFTNNFGMWYMELLGGIYTDPEIIGLLTQVRKVELEYLAADKQPAADIAVVLDEDSDRYVADGETFLSALLSVQKQWELNYIGAPYDCLLLRDFQNARMRDYKLYVFLNTFKVTPEQRVAVQERLRRNHATAVWVYAPGYIDRQLSVENIRALTGIRVAADPSAGELRVEVTSYDHPYTQSLPRGFVYGTDWNAVEIKRYFDHRLYLKDASDPSMRRDVSGFHIQPRFYGDDPEATVLGKLAGLDRPGLLVKAMSGWVSVYSSAPILRASLLRNIARAAGCHIYSDAGDVVYANRQFLALYAPGGGSRTVRLPRAARVTDLFSNEVVTQRSTEFPITIEQNATRMFRLE